MCVGEEGRIETVMIVVDKDVYFERAFLLILRLSVGVVMAKNRVDAFA